MTYELALKLKEAGCANCQNVFVPKSNVQVYCDECRTKVRKTKNKRWQHDYYIKNKARKLVGYRAYNKTERGRASQIVRDAIRQGKLKRLPCEVCGNKKSEGHHEDYSKPLIVRWLCSKHHREEHKFPEWRKELSRGGYIGKCDLSSLIEACGNMFYGINRNPDKAAGDINGFYGWRAFEIRQITRDDNVNSGYWGETPKSAVANLWLALNKK